MKILVLEPYYGGSHKNWINGLRDHLSAQAVLWTLPPRKWKMRMQLSAHYFVDNLQSLPPEERYFDCVLCSSLMDVAVFRSCLHAVEGWNQTAKILVYYHENQFSYPQQYYDPNMFQFTAINFNTACAADSIAFNSHYNKKSFLEGCKRLLKRASDMKVNHIVEQIEQKSRVLYPGIDYTQTDTIACADRQKEGGVTLVWNHRWEHDKNPEEFFKALASLERKNIEYNLIVLGQSFQLEPECFRKAREELSHRILHWGYVSNYQDYLRLLKKGDIVVSTALHEFFGIAVLEAVRCGCRPLLPDDLAYPEIFHPQYLYPKGDFSAALERAIRQFRRSDDTWFVDCTERFSWSHLESEYFAWVFGDVC